MMKPEVEPQPFPRDPWMRRILALGATSESDTCSAAGDGTGPELHPAGIRWVKFGFNPNSSSVGSVVSTLFWSATFAAVALNVVAALARRSTQTGAEAPSDGSPQNDGSAGAGAPVPGAAVPADATGGEPPPPGSPVAGCRPGENSVRVKSVPAADPAHVAFPARPDPGVRIARVGEELRISLEHPPLVIALDNPASASSPRFDAAFTPAPPLEVHLMATGRCRHGCPGCYVGATPDGEERPLDELRAAIDGIADLGALHVALGGGESLLRSDLFELAAYARSRGLVPNLTTSGAGMTPDIAARCRVFGQVNVSLDGVGEAYRRSRGYAGDLVALRALGSLAAADVACGINVVLDRHTFGSLIATVRAAADAGAREVELLRFKPSGRGRAAWADRGLLPAQHRALPELLRTLWRSSPELDVKVDCSLVPFLCVEEFSPNRLERFGVLGCVAGTHLAGVLADMSVVPCSFIPESVGLASRIGEAWSGAGPLAAWRDRTRQLAEPCASCPWLRICRGGCQAVVRAVDGLDFGPDPECPRVILHRAVAGHSPCADSARTVAGTPASPSASDGADGGFAVAGAAACPHSLPSTSDA